MNDKIDINGFFIDKKDSYTLEDVTALLSQKDNKNNKIIDEKNKNISQMTRDNKINALTNDVPNKYKSLIKTQFKDIADDQLETTATKLKEDYNDLWNKDKPFNLKVMSKEQSDQIANSIVSKNTTATLLNEINNKGLDFTKDVQGSLDKYKLMKSQGYIIKNGKFFRPITKENTNNGTA